MNHKDIKKELLQSPEVKEEYDALQVMYKIKREVIKLRLEQGLSQKDLAEKIGSKQSAISSLESDDYNPSIEFLNKIAHALGKKLEVNFN